MNRNSDKQIFFVATEVGSATENGVLSCGAENSELPDEPRYLMVQANLDEPDEWGPYFEFDDQTNSGYDHIQRVQLIESQLVFTLRKGMERYPDLKKITVDLINIDTAEVESLRVELNRCLEQRELQVEVSAAT